MIHRGVRSLFWLYAAALFVLTHWPKLAVPMGVPRGDLIQHLVAFGGWSALFTACGFFGRWNSRRNIAISAACGVLYACIDESLQALPVVNRVFGWDDMLFNMLGIALGSLAVSILAIRASPPGRR
jgi:hypothetical protein